MKASELKGRTKAFAVDVVKLVQKLPRSLPGRTIANPLIRAGTGVGAAYRGACRARSIYDFATRLSAVEEAAEESAYWLELSIETGLLPETRVRPMVEEIQRLRRIITKSRRAAQRRHRQKFGTPGADIGGDSGHWSGGDDDLPF